MTPLPPQRHRDLVITRAGAASLHPGWMSGAVPEFDLLVTTYSDAAPVARGEMRISVPGPKVAGYAKIFRQHPEIIERYDRIALIDNDIETDAAALNFCFAEGGRRGLRLWQPSLTSDSYFSWAMLLRNPWFQIRYTDFVEMMCPFFQSDALRDILPLFSLGYETGIDLLWAKPALIRARQVAVLDGVAVRHTRPVGATKTEQGFSETKNYTQQVAAFLESQGVKFSHPMLLEGVTRGGLKVRSRQLLRAFHAPLLRLLWLSPQSNIQNARAIYHFLRFKRDTRSPGRGQGR